MMTPEKGLFDDVLRSGEVAHGYYQVTSPEDWSQEMAREMLTSPSEAWFEAGRATSGTGLKSEFPDGEYMEVKSAYDKVLGEMRWDNCLVTVVSKDFRPEAKEEVRVFEICSVQSTIHLASGAFEAPLISRRFLVADIWHSLQGRTVHQGADCGLEQPGVVGRKAHAKERVHS